MSSPLTLRPLSSVFPERFRDPVKSNPYEERLEAYAWRLQNALEYAQAINFDDSPIYSKYISEELSSGEKHRQLDALSEYMRTELLSPADEDWLKRDLEELDSLQRECAFQRELLTPVKSVAHELFREVAQPPSRLVAHRFHWEQLAPFAEASDLVFRSAPEDEEPSVATYLLATREFMTRESYGTTLRMIGGPAVETIAKLVTSYETRLQAYLMLQG